MDLVDELRSQHKWTQSFGEELANTISHSRLVFAALIGTPCPAVRCLGENHDAAFFVGALVFAATVLLLYLGSALYHIWPQTRAKHIAASNRSRRDLPAYRWNLHAVCSRSVARSVGLDNSRSRLGARHFRHRHENGARRSSSQKLAMSLYLGMGWLILVAIRPLAQHVSSCHFDVACGRRNRLHRGRDFFVNERVRYCHFVWHLFVLGGTSCHFLAVLSCVSHT